MTVGELIGRLEVYDDHLEVVIEAAGIGKDDRTGIHDVQKALYELEEVHLIAEDGVR